MEDKKGVPSNQIIQEKKQAANQTNKKNAERAISSIASNTQKIQIPKQPEFDEKLHQKNIDEKQKVIKERGNGRQREELSQKSTLVEKAKQMVKTPVEQLKKMHKEVVETMPPKQSFLQKKAQGAKTAPTPKKQPTKTPPTKGRTK